jgi:hypothetical protein
MKLKVLFTFLIITLTSFGQESQGATFFGQCMIELQSQESAREIEDQLRQNPMIKVVRIDYNTQRAFILTQPLTELSESDFVSWFAEQSDRVRCVQVGRQGVDMVNPFPFEGCDK